MTPIIPSLSPLFEFQLPRNISGTDFGTGYGGTVCGFHTRPFALTKLTNVRVTGCRFVEFADSYTWHFQACTLFSMSIKNKPVTQAIKQATMSITFSARARGL